MCFYISSIDTKGRRFNWKEQEADEVGYEMYLRAGFKAEDFNFIEDTLMGEAERLRCQKENIDANLEPSRGITSHPELCWRKFDIQITERQLHKGEYESLILESSTKDVVEGRLREIQDKLTRESEDPAK